MIKVYIANRPPMKEYEKINKLSAMVEGEIQRIGQETGNHWRKIFNVYAKIVFSLALKEADHSILQYQTWQRYRDERLLQVGSFSQLHFACPSLNQALSFMDEGCIRMVMGKAFSETLLEGIELTWLDGDFATNKALGIIVCPYFDYRQLSNEKIDILVEVILSFRACSVK